MKLWQILIFFGLFLCFSCNQHSAKGIRCATGKAKKVKNNYRVKKIKAYQKGHGGGGESPTYAKRENQSANPVQSASVDENSIESIPVNPQLEEIPPEEQTAQETSSRDTIRRRVVERRKAPPSSPSQFTAQSTNEDSSSRDTIRRRTVERRSLETPEDINNPTSTEQAENTKDTIRRTTVIRQTSPSLASSISTGPNYALNTDVNIQPTKKVIYKGKEYVFEEDITFNERVFFIPNYDVFTSNKRAEKKLRELAKLLIENPDKGVTIRANAGWDVNYVREAPKYTRNPETGEKIKLHYGTSPEVYQQTIYELGLPRGSYEELKILSLGIELVDQSVVGELMEARNQAIKNSLMEMGVGEHQINTQLGEFARVNEHDVDFTIE